jgi:hypothetical protein
MATQSTGTTAPSSADTADAGTEEAPAPTTVGEIVTYQGSNKDVPDDLKKGFGMRYKQGSNERQWTFVWNRRNTLYDNVTATVAEKNGLLKSSGKSGSVTHIPEKKIKEDDKNPLDIAAWKIAFEILVEEVHQYYMLLKKTVKEINDLKASQGSAAGTSTVAEPVVGLPQPEASAAESLWKKIAGDMQAALGKWYDATGDNANARVDSIKFISFILKTPCTHTSQAWLPSPL